MPTSTYSQIPSVVRYLEAVSPQSILDIGLGNGKFGFIARDLLDVMHGERYRIEDWKIKIDGIEVFEDYIQEHQRIFYNDIFIGDAFNVIDRLGSYDLLYLGDVLEHFEKERAWEFLDKCAQHCHKHFIISIPLGENWTQPEIYGNPHEEHKSFWKPEELEPFSTKKEYLNFPGIGLYGIFLIEVSEYLEKGLFRRADGLAKKGKLDEAIRLTKKSLEKMQPSLENELYLTDLLVQAGRIEEALAVLKKAKHKFPLEKDIDPFIKALGEVLQKKMHENRASA